MTGDEYGGVDLDLLADYIGGALDGTPEHATVAGLIARNEAWRAAYRGLSEGMSSVGAGLAALGAAPEPMPAELVERLDRAFSSLPAESSQSGSQRAGSAQAGSAQAGSQRAGSQRAGSPRAGSPQAGSPHAGSPQADGAAPAAGHRTEQIGRNRKRSRTSNRRPAATPTSPTSGRPTDKKPTDKKPTDNRPADNRPAARPVAARPATAEEEARRRSLRRAVPVALIVVVLAFAGWGVTYLYSLNGSSYTASSTSSGAEKQSAPEAASGGAPDNGSQGLVTMLPGTIESSGTDYRRATLAKAAPASRQAAPNAAADTRALEPLAPLRPPDALLACLTSIAQENAAGPISVQSVDYARYAGAPAIVVRFTSGNGTWAWASGPACGTPGSGASRLDAAKVG